MNYIQQFEETYNLLNEIITPQAPASGAIAATKDSPRKDFGPASGNGYPPSMNKKGLLDPYQSHPYATMGDPDRIPSMPYPLENIDSYLSDSFVYLNAALTQMKAAAQSNPSLSPIFVKEIKRLTKEGAKALKCIEDIGKNITKVANLNY